MTIRSLVFLGAILITILPSVAQEPVDIGSRLELFVDDYVIDSLSLNANYDLKKPEAQEVALVTDAPWEGNVCAYYTIFQDGGLYRMYYRGLHYDGGMTHPEVTCYAESTDGINWTKPNLGIFEYEGSTDNNIVWMDPGSHNFTPFLDTNPDADSDAKYKALTRNAGAATGLYALQSPDGVHWTLMSNQPVIIEGAFDSQNLAFYDSERGCYVDYHRDFRNGVRDIKTATSDDFLNWSNPDWLTYTAGTPTEHLYTNAIQPYERAPHILLGFPTRYQPANSQVEPVLMTSRDGETFDRWDEALIPITAPEDRDGNRSNYMAWGLVQLPYSDRELSVYATEAYYEGPDSRIRRFTYRTDGFVSIQSPGPGEALTKPLLFEGNRLRINYAAFDGGSVEVEIQNAEGVSIPGFTFADFEPLTGDEIARTLWWGENGDVGMLEGFPVRLHFRLNNADLYSLQFFNYLPGDLNGDGMVGSADLDLVRANWGTNEPAGDANEDGAVNSGDLDVVRANWGASSAAAVPEPGVVGLAAGCVIVLWWRRREGFA